MCSTKALAGVVGIVLCLGHVSLGMGWRPFKSSNQDAGREARAFMRATMGRDVDVAGVVVVDKDGVPLDSVETHHVHQKARANNISLPLAFNVQSWC